MEGEPEQPAGEACAPPPDYFVDLYAELASHDPRSYAYRQLWNVICELGGTPPAPLQEGGCDSRPEDYMLTAPPPGFASLAVLEPAIVPVRQFFDKVPGLYSRTKTTYTAPAAELFTDCGRSIRLVDLRGVLRDTLRDILPTCDEQAQLDTVFYRQLGYLARNGTSRQSVKSAGGRSGTVALRVDYCSVRTTRLRAFYGPIETENHSGQGVRVYARFGDCGNDDKKETAFYRRIFNRTLRI